MATLFSTPSLSAEKIRYTPVCALSPLKSLPFHTALPPFAVVSKTIFPEISVIFTKLKNDFKEDWLLPLELYELALKQNFKVKTALKEYLTSLKSNKSYRTLIENGLHLLS